MALFAIPVTLLSSAARTSSSNTSNLKDTAQWVPSCRSVAIYLDVTAASGTTPTLDVFIQTSPDGATTWLEAFHFAQATAAITRRLNVRTSGLGPAEAGSEASVAATGATAIAAGTVLAPDVRLSWTIGGTNPSFTFAVYAFFQPEMSQLA